ncbi:MAG: DUF1786 domain-containing protein [Chloroflexi bacterium]|nr:DUF1786 domain-containing protein [Chloroflexota bacterium]
MKILTVDIGAGTQDIFLYDSRLDIENGFKLIAPSPTMMVHRRLKQATRRGQAALLCGKIMGGGPSGWAAEAHLRAGLPLYATPEAARTLNDDLDAVQALGVRIIGDDEAAGLPDSVLRLELRDFDFAAIARSFAAFDVRLDDLDAVAVAVFDHGDAPPDVSDRQFRFDYLDERIRSQNRLSAFAYRAGEIPRMMTRLQAVADSSAGVDAPLVVMDTAPAAVLGAAFDAPVAARPQVMIANVGNFHTLAIRLGPEGIEGVFEHHTGLLDLPALERLLRRLAEGSLRHEDVFGDHGHGALVYRAEPLPLGLGGYDVAVTGPRRSLFQRPAAPPSLRPYFATPFGDMMIAGCFGLLAAAADLLPDLGETIRASLNGVGGSGVAPWDLA